MYPFIFLGDGYRLPTYFVIIVLVCCLCLLWTYVRARRQSQEIKLALDIAMMIMAGGFIGGRLFHVIYEGFDYYRLFPADALRVWDGGFVYYGGFFGGFVFALLTMWVYKAPRLYWLDFFAPILAFGYGLGRLACFFNGCCYGALCELPWGVRFTYPGLPEGLRHPTQLYAVFWELFVTLPLLLILQRKKGLGSGLVFAVWLIFHGLGRWVMEIFRDDPRGAFLLNMSVSTWISVFLITSGLLLCAVVLRRRSAA